MIGQNYNEEDYNRDNFVEGDYRVRIESATEKQSSKGNPMIEIVLGINENQMKFRYYLVENEYFNQNATKLFDCFGIQRGNFNTPSWLRKVGTAHIAKGKVKDNGKSYFEVQYLIVPQAGQGPAPARQAPPPQQQAPRPQQPANTGNRTQWPPEGSGRAPAQPRQQAAAPAGDDFTDDIPF